MLHPHEVIEYMIAAIIVCPFIIFAFFLYWKKRNKTGFYIATLVLIGVISFFIIRPFWIDSQIDKKSLVLEDYLQVKYPDAEWILSVQNFRKHKTVNPYYLLVYFSDDPNYTYYYYVDRRGQVEQVGGQSNND